MDGSRADVKNAPTNVSGVILQARQGAFLAGWLAAKLEPRRPGPDVVGVVGGWKVTPVTDFVDGFAAGARRAAPRVRSSSTTPTTSSTVRSARPSRVVRSHKEQAGLQRRRRLRLGTMQAASDAGVWAIGVDSDQSFLGPHVLTSVLSGTKRPSWTCSTGSRPGRLRPGRDTTLTMRDGAAGLGRISPRVPHDLVTQLRRLERHIKSGTLRVSVASSDRGPPPTRSAERRPRRGPIDDNVLSSPSQRDPGLDGSGVGPQPDDLGGRGVREPDRARAIGDPRH